MYNWKGLTMYWKLPPDKRRKSTGFWQVSTNDLAPLQAFLTSTCEAILQSGHCHWIRANSEILSQKLMKTGISINHCFETPIGHLFFWFFVLQVPKGVSKTGGRQPTFFTKKKDDSQDFWKALRQLCDASAIFQWTLDYPQWDQIRGTFGGLIFPLGGS